jgi:hypothetical protein
MWMELQRATNVSGNTGRVIKGSKEIQTQHYRITSKGGEGEREVHTSNHNRSQLIHNSPPTATYPVSLPLFIPFSFPPVLLFSMQKNTIPIVITTRIKYRFPFLFFLF